MRTCPNRVWWYIRDFFRQERPATVQESLPAKQLSTRAFLLSNDCFQKFTPTAMATLRTSRVCLQFNTAISLALDIAVSAQNLEPEASKPDSRVTLDLDDTAKG